MSNRQFELLPGFVPMAAADEADLAHIVSTQVAIDDRPAALRYPAAKAVAVSVSSCLQVLTPVPRNWRHPAN